MLWGGRFGSLGRFGGLVGMSRLGLGGWAFGGLGWFREGGGDRGLGLGLFKGAQADRRVRGAGRFKIWEGLIGGRCWPGCGCRPGAEA